MTTDTDLVYGERRADLLPALGALLATGEEGPDGMVHYDPRLDVPAGAPLLRAALRAEAALLIEDADRLGTPEYAGRSPEQRRSDAFRRMVEAVISA